MEFSEESEIELESFIPRSSDQKDEGPPYDAKSKSRRHPGLYLQRAHFWICHNTRSKMLCFGILLIVGNFAKNSAAIYGTRKIAAGASIKSDYSNIGNLDDLRAISSSIDDFCFVSIMFPNHYTYRSAPTQNQAHFAPPPPSLVARDGKKLRLS
jgi:hypothetical protein